MATVPRGGGTRPMRRRDASLSFLNASIVVPALGAAFKKLDPRVLVRNPVMFVVEVVAALTTLLFLRDLVAGASRPRLLLPDQSLALVHGAVRQLRGSRGRGARQGAGGNACGAPAPRPWPSCSPAPDRTEYKQVPRPSLKPGDIVLVEAGDIIPRDGEVIDGVASVNEGAITGESAPVIRESGGDRSAVTGGTLVISDWIKVRITAAQGSTFLDRMIGARRGRRSGRRRPTRSRSTSCSPA